MQQSFYMSSTLHTKCSFLKSSLSHRVKYQLCQSISNVLNRNNLTKHQSKIANENELRKLQSFMKKTDHNAVRIQGRKSGVQRKPATIITYRYMYTSLPQSQRQKHSFVILHIDNFLQNISPTCTKKIKSDQKKQQQVNRQPNCLNIS